jgi:hypothetical protein
MGLTKLNKTHNIENFIDLKDEELIEIIEIFFEKGAHFSNIDVLPSCIDMVNSINNNEYLVTDTIYLGTNKKIKLLHTICNHEFMVTPNNFLNLRTKCPKCNKEHYYLSQTEFKKLNVIKERLSRVESDKKTYSKKLQSKFKESIQQREYYLTKFVN